MACGVNHGMYSLSSSWSGLTIDLTIIDHDGGGWQWSDIVIVDEALATLNSQGILLSWWFCT